MKRQIAMSDKSICIAVYINICRLTLYRNFNVTHYMLEMHHFWDKSMNVTQQPLVRDYPGKPVPEETFTHSRPSWSSNILYQLPPFTIIHVIARPLSTVEYTSVASLFHCRQWPWIGLVCRRGLFTIGWMCALKREQARREWQSELQHINSPKTLL